jgi:hypothetical protein
MDYKNSILKMAKKRALSDANPITKAAFDKLAKETKPMSDKLGHKIYKAMMIIKKLADDAVDNGDISGEDYELLYWHLGVMEDMLAINKEAKNADNKAKNKSGT